MSTSKVAQAALVGVLLLAVFSACSDDENSGDQSERVGTSTRTGSSTPEPYDPSALPALGRCGPQPPRLAGQRFRPLRLRDHGRMMPAVAIGQGRTLVVLVHQADGGGLCGWLSFAARIAAVPGQAASPSTSAATARPTARPATPPWTGRSPRSARRSTRPYAASTRAGLCFVGASMGGSLAVLTAARDHRPDAVVDLSGPDGWGGGVVRDRAAGVRAPLLVAMADDEGAGEVDAARATAAAAGPDSRFVGAESGHGYALLEAADGRPTPLSEQVLAWIAGR